MYSLFNFFLIPPLPPSPHEPFSMQLGAVIAFSICLSQSTSLLPLSPGPNKNKNQSFRAWLIKLLEEDSDDPESPPKDVNVNSASIEEIPDPVPPSRKGKGTPKLDFPLGL